MSGKSHGNRCVSAPFSIGDSGTFQHMMVQRVYSCYPSVSWSAENPRGVLPFILQMQFAFSRSFRNLFHKLCCKYAWHSVSQCTSSWLYNFLDLHVFTHTHKVYVLRYLQPPKLLGGPSSWRHRDEWQCPAGHWAGGRRSPLQSRPQFWCFLHHWEWGHLMIWCVGVCFFVDVAEIDGYCELSICNMTYCLIFQFVLESARLKKQGLFLGWGMLAISAKRGKVGGQQFSLNPLLEIHCWGLVDVSSEMFFIQKGTIRYTLARRLDQGIWLEAV